jgi:hypothetical protein
MIIRKPDMSVRAAEVPRFYSLTLIELQGNAGREADR